MYKLLEPFLVKFSFENNELIGEIKELELYAFGKSEIEIMNELKSDIIDLYEYYSEFRSKKGARQEYLCLIGYDNAKNSWKGDFFCTQEAES